MPSQQFMARYNAAVPDEGASTSRRAPNRFKVSTAEAVVAGFLDNIPWVDEIGARIDSFVYGMDYEERLQFNRDLLADAQSQNPKAYLGGQLAGIAVPAFGVATKGLKASMGVGAAYGAAYGSGYADEGGLGNRLLGGALGAGVGAVGGYAIEAIIAPTVRWAGGRAAGFIKRGKDPSLDGSKLTSKSLLGEIADAHKADNAIGRKAVKEATAKAAAKADPASASAPSAPKETPRSLISDTLEENSILTVKDLLGEPEAAAKAVAKRLGKMSPEEAETMLRTLKKAEAEGQVIDNPHFRSLLKIDLQGTGLKTEQVVRAAEIFEDAVEALAARAGQRKRTVKGMDQQVRNRLAQGVTLGELEEAYLKSQDGFVNTRLAQHVMLTAAAKVVRLREELLPRLLAGEQGLREKLAEELTDAAHRLVYAKGIMSNAGRTLGILSHGVKANLVDVADDAYKMSADEVRQRVNASLSKLTDQNLKELLARVRTMADAENLERILLDEAEAEAYSVWQRSVGSVALWLRSNALTPATFLVNAIGAGMMTALRGSGGRRRAIHNLRKEGRLDEALMLQIEEELHRSVRWQAQKVGLKAAMDRIKWEWWSDVEKIAAVGWGSGKVAAKARLKRGSMLSRGYAPAAMREFDDRPRLNVTDAAAFNAKNEARRANGGAFANIVYHLEKARAVTANTLDALGGVGMRAFTAMPDDGWRAYTRVTEGLAMSAREAFREAREAGVPADELIDYVKRRARELAETPTAEMMDKVEQSLLEHGDLMGDAKFLVNLRKHVEAEADARLFMDGPQSGFGKSSANLLEYDRIGLVFPYVRTPIRLFERGLVDYGPFHGMSKQVRERLEAGGVEAEIEKARIEIGMTVFNFGLAAGLAGTIVATNGGYENSANLDAGPPNRFNFPGGGFIEISRLDPFSLTVGMGAMVGQAIRDGYKDGAEYDQWEALRAVAATARHATADVILDKAYLKSLKDFLQAIDDSTDGSTSRIEKVLQNAATRFVPMSGVGRQFNDTFRTSAIESVGWADTLLRAVPGAGYGMAPKIDPLGDEVKSRPVGFNLGNSELTEGRPISPVKRKLRELGIDITTIRKSDPDGFSLTSEELSEVRRIRGKEARNSAGQTMSEALEELFVDPWFNALPTKDQKRAEVVEVMREFNAPAWEILMERNPKYASKKTYTKSLADYMAEGMTRSRADAAARQDLELDGLPEPDL